MNALPFLSRHLARLSCLGACALVGLIAPALAEDGRAQPGPETTSAPTTGDAAIRPRFELHVSSARTLVHKVRDSSSGPLVERVVDVLRDLAASSSETIDPEDIAVAIGQAAKWPDSAVDLLIYAPDTVGRNRWAIQLDWPVEALYERLDALLRSGAAETFLAGLAIRETKEPGYEIRLGDTTLAYLASVESGSRVVSHKDLPISAKVFDGTEVEDAGEKESPPTPLLSCRLHLSGTERDTGATFLSTFSAVTSIDYVVSIDDGGEFQERVRVNWPIISGMGAKMVLNRLKQTFFVPNAAFGALAFDSVVGLGMLEGMAGFGPQVMMEQPGQMEIVGEATAGPISRHAEAALCVTVLPGRGFLPMPDIVVQSRATAAEYFEKDVRKAVERINKLYRDRERAEPWHEIRVRDRAVFYGEGGGRMPGVIMPLVLRPVVFLSKERDAKDRERDFAVVAWTSTSPERLVQRWLDLPRTKDFRHIPSDRKNSGEAWIHWARVYEWAHPYVNIALSGIGSETLLPYPDRMADRLTHGLVSARVRYDGLRVAYEGPVPFGVLIVPSLTAAAAQMDRSGHSDLARERLANQRLQVLYHHSKLFKKDQGRWPATVAELDGYVDFAGNPELLKLPLSSQQRWQEWFKSIFEPTKADEKDEEEEEFESPTAGIDDSLYVIDWSRETWQLGFAPGTLVHLSRLYIDQDGVLHRVQREKETEESKGVGDEDAGSKKHTESPRDDVVNVGAAVPNEIRNHARD